MVDLTLPDASPAHDLGDATGRLVARVQAWQHRHPLARRLAAADVTGFGVIALPYAAAEGAAQPEPLFHQPSLVPGLSHRALVDFARRHAVNYRPGPADWPQRDIERADASAEPAPLTRYLLTAAVTEPVAPGASPRRLLIAPEGTAIWGPRPLSRPRVWVAVVSAGLLLLALGAAGWGLRARWARPVAGPPATAAAAAAASASAPLAPAASAPSAASALAHVSPAAVASSPASAGAARAMPPASSPASAAAAAVRLAASAPPLRAAPTPAAMASAVASAVTLGRAASAPKAMASAPLPAASAARIASAPPASVRPVAPPPLLPMPSKRRGVAAPVEAPSEPASAASAAPVPEGPHFALVSVPSRKRAGAEATLAQVRKVLGPAIGNLQAQIMPSPEGYVVTIWPLPTQADAEGLADVLGRRGVPMKWLEF